MPPKGADEGASFGMGSVVRGEFRRLRAASYFAHGGKVTKTPPGTAQDGHFVSIFAFPRTPLRGTRTCQVLQYFRRAKFEWLSAIPAGPPGPGSAKFAAGAVPLPRLALPSKRQGPLTAGAPRGSPTQIRECSGYFVGEGTTPLVKRRWPEGPEGIGNCPSRHSLEWSVARRRGGCPHPPAVLGNRPLSSVGAAHWAARRSWGWDA